MAKKKGYSQAFSDMTQSNDYLFDTNEAGYNDFSDVESATSLNNNNNNNNSSKKSFLKNWTSSALGHSNDNSPSSSSNNNNRVIGASYSHFEKSTTELPYSLNRSHSHTNSSSSNNNSNNNNNNRRSLSPERINGLTSTLSNQSSLTPRTSINFSRNNNNGINNNNNNSSIKKHLKFDDNDNDWDDSVDDLNSPISDDTKSFYPSLDALTLQSPTKEEKDKSIDIKTPIKINNDNNQEIKPHEVYPFLRNDYEEIMKDPFSILTKQKPPEIGYSKYNKITKALLKQPFEMNDLKRETWGGIPETIRPLIWQVLLGYLPVNPETREMVLKRKRREYRMGINQLFQNEKDPIIWHQISIDVPRTNPTIKLYSFETTQRSLEKILYMWAIRHPASGYVQGINDLVTPLFQVFLKNYLISTIKLEEFNINLLPSELLNCIETDTFWCLTKILDTIQDNYIHEQPGIIKQVTDLENLVKRDEPILYQHFKENGIEFIQFSFRWMNCMLMRELNINLIIRMWDTYISDYPTGFNKFHVYVCCAFLRKFSDILFDMDFQDMIIYLQDNQKTKNWTFNDVEMILSEAFVWKSLYENASAHLKN